MKLSPYWLRNQINEVPVWWCLKASTTLWPAFEAGNAGQGLRVVVRHQAARTACQKLLLLNLAPPLGAYWTAVSKIALVTDIDFWRIRQGFRFGQSTLRRKRDGGLLAKYDGDNIRRQRADGRTDAAGG